ncbi:MAG: 5-amino-6-(D-ribitylamino)uracil--L-tyrosine 4-hydroxyphenyl transferase CofH [Acidimicrobiales bacterium]|nr:5-amino-6-(D-ribitylamino)uracil--L-tyrosine 4-hydroxyphenyl transferase CofH [Acidimicrobiales bacterium]
MQLATQIRDSTTGNYLTYSPKVFIPLTKLCRDKCGYCTFSQPPARLQAPYMSIEEVLEIARRGSEMGCYEALFTLGENPEDRYPVARKWLDDNGYSSTIEYLHECSKQVLSETGLLPHANAGAISYEDLELLRQTSPSQGMMLESLDENLLCHRGSPDKTPERRLATLRYSGELNIAFTTGLLVGIGEDRTSRLETLLAIADIHEQYGNIQEVIVQNFLPKPGTAMFSKAPCDTEEHLWTIAAARVILPGTISIQAPPNLVDSAHSLISAGIDDFGGVSPLTIDHVNPERAWPALAALRLACESSGFELLPRLTIHSRFLEEPEKWIDKKILRNVLAASDSIGMARDSNWISGGNVAPESLIPYPTSESFPSNPSTGRVSEILSGIEMGQEPGIEEVVALFNARGREVGEIVRFADNLREQIVGEDVSWVHNRNINYTNVCTFKCRFCAFSKGPLSLNLRGNPYLLTLDDVALSAKEAFEEGSTEVCLQGGIHPDFDGEYYLSVLAAIKETAPDIHIHAFSALEVFEGARRLGEPVEKYLARLKEAGLKSLPGTAAEILDDPIRKILCPDKISTEEWLHVHKSAHEVGLTSNVTIMFGAVESPVSWAKHLLATLELGRQTGGFLEFVPLPYVHMGAPLYIQGKSRRGPTWRETLLMHSVGRIIYREVIPNIQAGWVKLGVEGVRQALLAGCNDMGGSLTHENISRAAGAEHGQAMDYNGFLDLVEPLGRPLVQRNTRYERV